MSTIDVSVIVPCHNAEAYVATALSSALSQHGPKIEVIVIDDGSRDRSHDIVNDLSREDPRIRLIRQPEASGPGAARNMGIEVAAGEWIALLDADDRYAPGRLDRLLASAGDADLVSDDLLLVDGPTGRTIGSAWGPATLAACDPLLAAEFIERNRFDRFDTSFGFMKPIFRRRFLELHGLSFPTTLRIAEDYGFFLSCLLAGAKWKLVGEPLYHYLQWPASLSRKLNVQDLERMLHANDAVRQPGLPDDVEAALQRRYRSIQLFLRNAAAVDAVRNRDLGGVLRTLAAEPRMFTIFAHACCEGALKRIGLLKSHDRLRLGQWWSDR